MRDVQHEEKPDAPRRFLDAAARLFAQNGYHAVSMREIARELGVTPGAAYAHYPSKAHVLAAVYAEGVRRIAEKLDAAIEDVAEPWHRLERAAQAHLEAVLNGESGYAPVVIRVLPADAPEMTRELTALRDGYEDRFRALIAQLPVKPGTDLTILRMTLLGALNWSRVWYAEGSARPDEIARHVVATLRDGVAPAEEKPR